jgi:hypothetical protein
MNPNRCKEDRVAMHVLLRLTEHISCVSEHSGASRAFFLDSGWVFSKTCISGFISNDICMEAGDFAQSVYALNYLSDCADLWPCVLRRGSAAARLLGLLVRIPQSLWRFVCCVLSGRGLCVRPILCPEESYRLWCLNVIVKPR